MSLSAVTLTFAAIVVVLWLRWRKKHFSKFEHLGIPGPKPNIFFGNILEMRRKGPIQAHADWIKKYGKVVGFYYGFRPVLLIADLDILKEVEIKNFNSFVNRADLFSVLKTVANIFDHQLVNLKDQHWKEVRGIMTPAFTSGKMKQMSDVMNRAVDDLVEELTDKASGGKEFDIYSLYQGLTMDVIGQTALGIESGIQKNNDHPMLQALRLIFSSGTLTWIFITGRSFLEFRFLLTWLFLAVFTIRRKGVNPITQLVGLCQDIVRQRKSDPSKRRGDLLQGLIDAEGSSDPQLADKESEQQETKVNEKGGGIKRNLTDTEITANALVILLAGYETTSTTLAFATFYLAKHPELQEKLYQEIKQVVKTQEGDIPYSSLHEMKYMVQVIHEALRIAPPIYQFVTREATEEVELGRWQIPKGMAVMVPVYHLHHDPDNWEDPETFDPNRFVPEMRSSRDPMAWQAFGAGPRNCIGMRFAMMEAKLALAKIFIKYRLVPSDKTDKSSPELLQGTATITPKNRVFVKAVLRSGLENN